MQSCGSCARKAGFMMLHAGLWPRSSPAVVYGSTGKKDSMWVCRLVFLFPRISPPKLICFYSCYWWGDTGSPSSNGLLEALKFVKDVYVNQRIKSFPVISLLCRSLKRTFKWDFYQKISESSQVIWQAVVKFNLSCLGGGGGGVFELDSITFLLMANWLSSVIWGFRYFLWIVISSLFNCIAC